MKKVVFFFINPSQISVLSNNTIATENLPDTENYYVISQNGYNVKHNSVTPVDLAAVGNEVVITVKDTFDISEIVSLLKEYKTTKQLEIYAVFHQTTGNSGALSNYFISELGKDFKSSISEHEIVGSVYDRYLIPIVKSNSAILLGELLSKFPDPVLEAKLELLHQCLVPSGIQAELPIAFKNAVDNEKYKSAYKEFADDWFGKSDDDVFNPKFIDSLIKLRKALLGS